MLNTLFLTGTDTEIGKTLVAAAMLHAWRDKGLSVVGYKPVAAGGVEENGVWINDDAAMLRAASSPGFSQVEINPVCMPAPVAPHIAAAEIGRPIELNALLEGYAHLSTRADRIVVEGVGGFIVPLDEHVTTADLARALALPVVLVVGLRLGCISHALLTAEAISNRGLKLAGWVANCVDPAMQRRDENIKALLERLPAPCLGVIPHLEKARPEIAAQYLRLAI